MNILLLGKNGQVGWELQRALAPLGTVIAHGSDTANFTQPDQVAALETGDLRALSSSAMRVSGLSMS